MQSHEHFMQRALELAARGTGCTTPNPLVGCVIVRDGVTLGEGWHAHYGQHHAEVNALRSVATDTSTVGATLYVTLEPCNHQGLTPPCTQAILDAGISHVIYALADPNPRAAGGAQWLNERGVHVTQGVLEQEARFQNRFFLHYLQTQRPYLIAKSASSLDGRIATRSGDSQWITGPEARQRGHELRQAMDAIIVGADTVIADNPSLTVRLPESVLTAEQTRHPRPVILDSQGRVPLTATLLNPAVSPNTVIAATQRMSDEHRRILESRGFEVLTLPENPAGIGVDPHTLLEQLAQHGLQSALLEGGATVQGVFKDAGLISEVWCFLAPSLIGGKLAPAAYAASGSETLDAATALTDVRVEFVGKDLLIRALTIQPEQTTPPAPSATHFTDH